jgi:hypothetical protein
MVGVSENANRADTDIGKASARSMIFYAAVQHGAGIDAPKSRIKENMVQCTKYSQTSQGGLTLARRARVVR